MPSTSRVLESTAMLLIFLVILTNIPQQINGGNHLAIDRKSLVFDLKTPKVFYCLQEKPSDDQDKLIVKAQPLEKLCEFEGKRKAKNMASDCYDDLDESEFACDEKRRFLIKLELASEGANLELIDELDNRRGG